MFDIQPMPHQLNDHNHQQQMQQEQRQQLSRNPSEEITSEYSKPSQYYYAESGPALENMNMDEVGEGYVNTFPASPAHSPYSSDNSNDSTLSNSPNSSKSSDGTASNSSSRAPSTAPVGVNLRVTGQCSQGGRKYMEDYFSVAYQQSENAKDLEYAYIGIFDGHGGAEAAIYAKKHLMMEIIKQKQFWSENDHDVLRAIREGYIATHYAMWRDQENWPKTSNGLPSTAGTTATIAFIRREKIYIGHVGDSGIVLGYQNEDENFWRAKSLTNDHKPECLHERTRIRKAGGKVIIKSGVPRVVWRRPRNPGHVGPLRFNTAVDEIPFLAVARSLGDLWSYNPENRQFVVSPDPDVKVIRINPKTFRCLIFGTDGLWNVMGAQDAVDKVYEKESVNRKLNYARSVDPNIYDDANENVHWSNPSKALVEDALKVWNSKRMRADNTSVVTVILYPANEDPGYFGDDCPRAHLPISYGVDYTEVQGDIPLYKDNTSYAELAEKFAPPEAYRNFNYYEIEEPEIEDNEADTESEDETNILKVKTESKVIVEVANGGANGLTNHHHHHHQQLHNGTYLTEETSTTHSYTAFTNLNGINHQPEHHNALDGNAVAINQQFQDGCNLNGAGDDEENDESDSDEEDGNGGASSSRRLNKGRSYTKLRSSLPSSCLPWTGSKSNLYLNDGNDNDYDILENSNDGAGLGVHISSEESDDSNLSNLSTHVLDGYNDIGMSFAETFNCILQNQDTHEEANQTTLVQKCTKSYASMQEIIKEHQTMSEEEGYSLTKLETRQEKAQSQKHHQQPAAASTSNIYHHSPQSTTTNHFHLQHNAYSNNNNGQEIKKLNTNYSTATTMGPGHASPEAHHFEFKKYASNQEHKQSLEIEQVDKLHHIVHTAHQTSESLVWPHRTAQQKEEFRTNCFYTTVNYEGGTPSSSKKLLEEAAAALSKHQQELNGPAEEEENSPLSGVEETEEKLESLEVELLQVPALNTNTTAEANVESDPEEAAYTEYIEEITPAVQINEISSSNINDVTIEDLSVLANLEDDHVLYKKTKTMSREIVEAAQQHNNNNDSSSRNRQVIYKKLTPEVKTKSSAAPSMTANRWESDNRMTQPLTRSSSNHHNIINNALKRSLSKANLTSSSSACSANCLESPAKRIRTRFYQNIPNENQSLTKTSTRITNNSNSNNNANNKTNNKSEIFVRSRSHSQMSSKSSSNTNSNRPALHGPEYLEKRQLRSSVSNYNAALMNPQSNAATTTTTNTTTTTTAANHPQASTSPSKGNVSNHHYQPPASSFIKKTLRTRNVLAKDLKNNHSSSATFINAGSTPSRQNETKDFIKNSSNHNGKNSATSPRLVLVSESRRGSISAPGSAATRRIASTSNLPPMNSLNASANSNSNSNSKSNPLLSAAPTLINLRSRQINEASPHQASRSASASRVEFRRNLRSVGSASNPLLNANGSRSSRFSNASSSGSSTTTVTKIKITPSTYSKTTKIQSTGKGNGAISLAPPPSPKLISLPSTISTRARSLQNIKSAASIALIKTLLPRKPTLRNSTSITIKTNNCDSRNDMLGNNNNHSHTQSQGQGQSQSQSNNSHSSRSGNIGSINSNSLRSLGKSASVGHTCLSKTSTPPAAATFSRITRQKR